MHNCYITEAERHIPVKADTAYTSVLEDPGPLGEIRSAYLLYTFVSFEN